jgi:hypothetical protein
MLRFLGLVPVEYARGVRNGQVTIDLEIREAVTFRDGAAAVAQLVIASGDRGMAKERGFRTTVTSNGLLYPKRAESLAGKIDLLHFSIDSSDPDEHNRSRGVRCFDKLMESIEVALSIGERPDLLFTITDDNVEQLEQIYEKISRPNKLVLIINPLFEYNALGSALPDAVMNRVEKFARKPYTYLNPAFLTLRRHGGNDPEKPVCKAVSTCVVISPFNELVLPCYHFGLEKIPINNGLYDLWHSDTVARHKKMEGRHEVCRGCTVNCYFEPSFAVSPESGYFWQSLPSKVNYVWTKFLVQRLDAKLSGSKKAILPVWERRLEGENAIDNTDDDTSGELVELPVLDGRKEWENL